MKITIKRFTLFLLIIVVSVLLSISIYNHISEQEKTAGIILKSIKTKLSEINYVLSRSMSSKETVKTSRPILDRVSANSEFIDSIMIHDGKDVLVSSDIYSSKIASGEELYNENDSAYDNLIYKVSIEDTIRYYEGSELKTLQLAFLFDKHELNTYFKEERVQDILLFSLVPLIVISFVWFLIRKFISSPLESLRQFAYYEDNVPSSFAIRELEVIRHSMAQTFSRLEDEKSELYNMARTDSLSGLANRNSLMEFLTRTIENSKRHGSEFAVLFLDLDHFKSVNDSLGHNVGDELLKNVARVIDDILRPSDFVARVGGDEFIIIIQDYKSLIELKNIIERIQNILAKKWLVHSNPISISSSVGISIYPKDGEDIVTLMKNSDIAMYAAKNAGRSRYSFFTDELNKKVQDSIVLDKDMHNALANNEYKLYYQPKIDLETGSILSVEALVRWISPSRGFVSPADFIPLAEENGFIKELGEWVYQTAIKQQKVFIDKGIDVKMSINFSSKQFESIELHDKLAKCLEVSKIPAGNIDIEITEYLFIQDNDRVIEALNKIENLGMTISLDDFGTGYSSLSYLKNFPIDHLKIDKSFIDDFDKPKGAIFIDTIVQMGKNLGMKVIAEGVETKEQVAYLKSINCDQYQGYYACRPISADDFEDFYLEHKGVFTS